ncbi:MAG: ABC transporter permease [Planctomycetaceae bacterium]|nr:ABC transporter permease [Planctomycetaceae bacterium]MBT5123461.1 ABC transporter permease [Planctomycetaceae bacterium]
MTLPRRSRHYALRAIYVTALLILMSTSWMILAGTQVIQSPGDLARFGATFFQILAPLQLALLVFLSAFGAASAVAQEKDKRTLILLLLTQLTNQQLVLGKLLAALLTPLIMVLASLPVLLAVQLFGGVSNDQVARVLLITFAATLVAGTLGSTFALWREKTFQTLSLTTLTIVLWIGLWEGIGVVGASNPLLTACADWASPIRGIAAVTVPRIGDQSSWSLSDPAICFSLFAGIAALLLNLLAIIKVRVWNPTREVRSVVQDHDDVSAIWDKQLSAEEIAEASRGGHVDSIGRAATETTEVHATRRVWDNPVLWREICTWAYGRKILIIRIAYICMSLLAFFSLNKNLADIEAGATLVGLETIIPPVASSIAPLFLVSLIIINALAVNSITNERDGQALDLLLVTDLSPREFIFGKLWGVLYVTKEMVIMPILIGLYLTIRGGIDFEGFSFLIVGFLALLFFVTILGIHCGLNFANSRAAISVSMGSVFFLFLGVVTCIMIMISFSGSFEQQLAPFLAFILGGSIGLYVALGFRNPSPAIFWSTLLLPFATFHAITSFFIEHHLTSVTVVTIIYGFTTLAMLMPAIGEFDVAMGRTKSDDE